MYAAYIERLGPPEVIQYGTLEAPRPGATDVLVDVAATTVNPVDTFLRSGIYRTTVPFPFVIGRDLVGTVVWAGPGAPGFSPGERVWCNSLGHCGRQGAAAQQAVVPADRLYHLPTAADLIHAVAVAHPAGTAYLALFTHGRLQAGETVVISGAAGNVGSALVVLASYAGARVIATAHPRDAEYCRSLGARVVLDYRSSETPRQIADNCPEGVDIYVDAYGANDLSNAVELLAFRGRIILLAGVRTEPVLPAGPLYMKEGSIRGFVISHADSSDLAAAARLINQLLVEDRLRARTVDQTPLSSAAAAHRRMERGELRGKRQILITNTDLTN